MAFHPITFRKELVWEFIEKFAPNQQILREEDVIWFLKNVLKVGYLLFIYEKKFSIESVSLRIGGQSSCCLSLEGDKFKVAEDELPSSAMILSRTLAREIYDTRSSTLYLRDIKVPLEFFRKILLPRYLGSPLLKEFAAELFSRKLGNYREILP